MTFIRSEMEARASDHIHVPEHLVREALRRTPKGQLVTVLGPLDLIEQGFVFDKGVVVAWPKWYAPEGSA